MSSSSLKYLPLYSNTAIELGYKDAGNMRLFISTYTYNIKYRDLDNILRSYTTTKNYDWTTGTSGLGATVSFSTPRTGKIKLYPIGGGRDVYSLRIEGVNQSSNNVLENKVYIEDLGRFLRQFNRLYSFVLDEYSYNTTAQMPTIIGDFAKLPVYLKKVLITNMDVVSAPTNLYLNASNYPANSQLESFVKNAGNEQPNNYLRITGDLGKLPTTLKNFYIARLHSTSDFIYSTKTWASDFSRFYIPSAPASFRAVTADRMLADMARDITAPSGDKTITVLKRTTLSDANVAILQGRGITVSPSTANSAVLADTTYSDIESYCAGKSYPMPSGTALQTFINKLKTISNGAFWMTRDTLFIRPLLGNSTTHNGLRKVNLRKPTNQEQVFYGGLTLNSYGGLQGNGVDAYIDLVTPVNAYDNYKQDDAGIIVVKTTSESGHSISAFNATTITTAIGHYSVTGPRINTGTGITGDYTGLGAIGLSRSNSAIQRVMFKSAKNNQTASSVALYSISFNQFLNGVTYSSNDNLLLITGASFTDDEYDLVRQYFNEYLTEIGFTAVA